MNKRLKLIFDKALCELFSRVTGLNVVYKKPLTNVQIKNMRDKMENKNGQQ